MPRDACCAREMGLSYTSVMVTRLDNRAELPNSSSTSSTSVPKVHAQHSHQSIKISSRRWALDFHNPVALAGQQSPPYLPKLHHHLLPKDLFLAISIVEQSSLLLRLSPWHSYCSCIPERAFALPRPMHSGIEMLIAAERV